MTQRSSSFVRALWFVFVGWWATPIVVNSAWLLNVTVILLPIGIKLINLVPTVLTRGATVAFRTRVGAGATLAHRPGGLLCPRRLVAEPAVGERGVIPRNHGRGAPGRNLDAQPTAVRHVAVPVSRVTLAVIAWSEMSEANSRPTLSTSFVAATASASVSVTSIDS